MTRQKKELNKKIEEIYNFINADSELGAGFAPSGFYDPLYTEIYKLQKQLATLSHFETVEDMLYNTKLPKELPFN